VAVTTRKTAFLREMLEDAKNYIQSFSWCDSIVSSYFAGGGLEESLRFFCSELIQTGVT